MLNRHLERLAGLHPDLLRVINKAMDLSHVEFIIVEGVRSDQQCYVNWGKGRTYQECIRAGIPQATAANVADPDAPKVTWLGNPLSSNHRKKPDGFGHAVDLLPAPYDWKVPGGFDELAKAMFEAAMECGVKIRWGADWNENGRRRERGETDNPHFELAPEAYPG